MEPSSKRPFWLLDDEIETSATKQPRYDFQLETFNFLPPDLNHQLDNFNDPSLDIALGLDDDFIKFNLPPAGIGHWHDFTQQTNVNVCSLITDQQISNGQDGQGQFFDNDLATSLPQSMPGPSEVQVNSTSIEEVCFGMLYNIPVQLRWPPSQYDPKSQVLGDGNKYITMEMAREENEVLLQTERNHKIGCLSKGIAQIIATRTNQSTLSVKAWIQHDVWETKSLEVLANKDARKRFKLPVNLNLCGPRNIGKLLAKDLGSLQLFLQEPLPGSISTLYENPQEMAFHGEQTDIVALRSSFQEALRSLGLAERAESTLNEQPANKEQMGNLFLDFEEIFARPPEKISGSNEFTQDHRITSKIKGHQHEGVQFMLRRENPTFNPEEGLWEQINHPEGGSLYQHRVTDVKSRNPEDFPGGIIADDPGLGKTLLALATVLETQGEASNFGFGTSMSLTEKCPVSSRSKATLVIVPSEPLLVVWVKEIDKHVRPGVLRYLRYHGSERRQNDSKIASHDIVLTTYGTVLAEHKRGNSVLFQTTWFRLILDEAHIIRNSASKQFQAVHGLSAMYRWCLTGTPIQNSLDDIGSLVQFLRMPQLQDPTIFRKHIATVQIRKGCEKAEFKNLQMVMSSICLRRKRSLLENGDNFETVNVHPAFCENELQQYRNLILTCKRELQRYTNGEDNGDTHYRAMEAVLRLRMFCNNGIDKRGLLPPNRHTRPDEHVSILQQSGEAKCFECYSEIHSLDIEGLSNSGRLTHCCQNMFCTSCMCSAASACPRCKTSDQGEVGSISSAQPQGKNYPSKVRMLVDDIKKNWRHKCIVFSFWKMSLDIVSEALRDNNIKFLRVDGDVVAKKRNIAMQDFQMKQAYGVLLMTFSTGSTGLNGLTVANRVHLLEPQWNPAAEDQAIGRLLRLDQKQKVTVIRYAVRGTIEEGIQTKQIRKLQLAGGGFKKQTKKARSEKEETRLQEIQGLHEYLNISEEDHGAPSSDLGHIQQPGGDSAMTDG